MMYLLALLMMTLFGALGGFFLKMVSLTSIRKKKLYMFLIGGFFYGAGAIVNVIILRFLPYTIVFPLTAFTYVWTLLLSYLFMKETINRHKVIGVMLIIFGAILISQG
ncbi:EamA family transporter [Listeria sp. PSOL-1]|uniref:EamA family transporter n=1 Tax=Listeria sp. PSOL-1 TaxID=1844999 RepID=UPI0013D23DBB|nr:EamA family transporter [Listeria sp. PSOL-1]